MEKFIKVTKTNIDELLEKYDVFLFLIRNSRIKAKQTAILEVYSLLINIDCKFIINPPCGDVKGVFAFFINKKEKDLENLFKRLGYCNKVYKTDFENFENKTEIKSINEFIWKEKRFGINNFYIEDKNVFNSQSPDNRDFVIKTKEGVNKKINGYRGDGTELGKRALPTEDARCLLNLSLYSISQNVIDPFAGGGGIVYQAKYFDKNKKIYSVDIDESVSPGLEFYGASHFTDDASKIKLPISDISQVTTEIPFFEKETKNIISGLINISKYTTPKASFCIMCIKSQEKNIIDEFKENDIYLYYKTDIDRKGTDVCILCFSKSKEFVDDIKDFIKKLLTIY